MLNNNNKCMMTRWQTQCKKKTTRSPRFCDAVRKRSTMDANRREIMESISIWAKQCRIVCFQFIACTNVGLTHVVIIGGKNNRRTKMYLEFFLPGFWWYFAVRPRKNVQEKSRAFRLVSIWKVIGQNKTGKLSFFTIVKAIRWLSIRHFSAVYKLAGHFHQPNHRQFVLNISWFTLFCKTCETLSSICCDGNCIMFSAWYTKGLNKSVQHMIYFPNCFFIFFTFFLLVRMRIFVRNGVLRVDHTAYFYAINFD